MKTQPILQNAWLLNVKAGGPYSYHCALKCQELKLTSSLKCALHRLRQTAPPPPQITNIADNNSDKLAINLETCIRMQGDGIPIMKYT
jgi:hypothetical protein